MNAANPFEFHAQSIVEGLARDFNTFERLEIKALFNCSLSKVSDSKIDAEVRGDVVVGTGMLMINPIGLIQSAKTVFELVLPHEFAHILTKATGLRDGVELAEHGEEWYQVLHAMDKNEASLPFITHDDFDFNATRLMRGYVGWRCSCHRTFEAVFNTNRSIEKYVNEGVTCDYCQGNLERVAVDDYPEKYIKELKWLSKMEEMRLC